jgi:hypothetical protein
MRPRHLDELDLEISRAEATLASLDLSDYRPIVSTGPESSMAQTLTGTKFAGTRDTPQWLASGIAIRGLGPAFPP